jgi:hypothetical protein
MRFEDNGVFGSKRDAKAPELQALKHLKADGSVGEDGGLALFPVAVRPSL